MKYRWRVAPDRKDLVQSLGRDLGLCPILIQCLANRGMTDADIIGRYLNPLLQSLGDPFILPGMSAAVDRLVLARQLSQRIVLFGDYDVDGVTSVALLYEFLTHFGWRCEYYLPNRMEEGYGLSREGVENCLRHFCHETNPIQVLLAVDCGSTAVASVDWLKSRGVDVLVLDHHQISQPRPEAMALVNPLGAEGAMNPERDGTAYCSAGLAFKMAHAVLKRGRQLKWEGAENYDLRPLLDLAALGTIADLVPLTRENRVLVKSGLERLSRTTRPGLVALKEVAKTSNPLEVYDVAFQLAPRLNAAGRLESAMESLELLLEKNPAGAMARATKLNEQNQRRQSLEKTIVDEALVLVRAKHKERNDLVIVEGREDWHIGVVGIVASRIVQEFHRPALILGGDRGELRGSGRSIEGFDLAQALLQCRHLLSRHGGHAMAAGLALSPDHLEAFREAMNHLARQSLNSEQLQPVLRLDAEVRLDELTWENLAELDRLKPFGQGNPPVQLCVRGVVSARSMLRMGKEKQHLKFHVTDGQTTHEAVWWNARQGTIPSGSFDLAFAPAQNEFQGRRTVQLKVLDIVEHQVLPQ